MDTLGNILKVVKLIELRERVVDDYFEYILASYILGNDMNLLEELGSVGTVRLPLDNTQDRIVIKTKFLGERARRAQQLTEDVDANIFSLTPDYILEFNSETYVIDTYNGSSPKRIKQKLLKYKKHFPDSHIYVFASGIATYASLYMAQNTVRLYHLTETDLKQVPHLSIGSMTVNVDTLNSIYFNEFKIFSMEVVYWLTCSAKKRII